MASILFGKYQFNTDKTLSQLLVYSTLISNLNLINMKILYNNEMDRKLTAKEIGRAAGREFAHQIPLNWAIRDQEDQEDYGIDAEIEVTNEVDNATGFLFKVQIKGTGSIKLIKKDTLVSFSLSVERLKYYIYSIELPVLLIVVDIISKRIYWSTLQDKTEIKELLNEAIINKQEELTVHIPTDNLLLSNGDKILDSVLKNMDWLKLNAVNNIVTPIDSLINVSSDNELEKLIKKSKSNNYYFFNEKLERLLVGNKFDELYTLASNIMDSSLENIETRFSASLYIERYYFTQENSNTDLEKHYIKMVKLSKSEKSIDFLELSILLLRSFNLKNKMELFIQKYTQDVVLKENKLWKPFFELSNLNDNIRISETIMKIIKKTNAVINSSKMMILLEMVPRITYQIYNYADIIGKKDEFINQSLEIKKWIEICINLSIDYAIYTKTEDKLAQLLFLKATYVLEKDKALDNQEFSLEKLKLISNKELQNKTLKLISDYIDKKNTVSVEDELDIYRSIAISLGIKIDDPEDRISQIINIGLKDYNPERVIKDCIHLVMLPTKYLGEPAKLVGLPTAGRKWLYCLKKEYCSGGWNLDEIYKSPVPGCGFYETNCSKCEDKKPRDNNWEWNSEWQRSQNIKFKKIIDTINSY